MIIDRRKWLGCVAAVAAVVLAWTAVQPPATAQKAQGDDLVIFAAASLKNALDAANAQWQKDTGKTAKISYAASSALAKQIEQGAPAQMFISADLDWMDYLAGKNLIKADTRSNFLGNRIVLVNSSAGMVQLRKLIGDGPDLYVGPPVNASPRSALTGSVGTTVRSGGT